MDTERETSTPRPRGKSGEGHDAIPELGPEIDDADDTFKVQDRRHWNVESEDDGKANAEAEPRRPSIVDEFRQRAEQAEAKLQEYIGAFKQHQSEQDNFRERLERDVERKVRLQFSGLVGELLETVDTLELSLGHVQNVPEAAPLAQGVEMARDRFVAILERHGVTRIRPDGQPFDPEEAEALRVDPVNDPAKNDVVTETLQAGFRLGDLVIRPARVAVGRHQG